MRVRVLFGHLSEEQIAEALACVPCDLEAGRGRAPRSDCPLCEGTREDYFRGYTYEGSADLEVGDRVVLPGSWNHPEEQVGTIISLQTRYQGEVKNVVRRA